jgi:adenosylhomocysteine nucleosidase
LWYNEKVMGDLGRIGLVGVHHELLPLHRALEVESQERHGETVLYTGSIGSQPVSVAEVLIGPVSAAMGTQLLITRCGVSSLISLGSAGALTGELSLGDLVVANRAVAHDAGVFSGRQFQPSGIMGRDERGRIGQRRAFPAHPGLVAMATDAARRIGADIYVGTVVTGNQAIFSTPRKHWLHETFDALAVEMETAAVAQVAVTHRLPWGAVRAISDTVSDDLSLEHGRLWLYLDDGVPIWRQRFARWSYLLLHPNARRRLSRLHQGLSTAAEQASRLVETMLQG